MDEDVIVKEDVVVIKEEIKEEVKTETETVQKQEEVKVPTKQELLRELSKEHGINLFDAKGLTAFKVYQDAQKTEQERLVEQVDSFKEKENKFNSDTEVLQNKIAGLELNIPTDKLDDALALAKTNKTEGQSIKEALKAIQEKYKGMFVKDAGVKTIVQVGTQMSNNDANLNVSVEPTMQRYLDKQKK